MQVKIIKSTLAPKAKVFTIRSAKKDYRILSIDRAAKWRLHLEDVAECLLTPDEVLKGHSGRFIAHKLSGVHLIRAVYEYDDDLPVLITVYYPYSKRYYKGGGVYEDKIF